jgi:phage terminase large subunit-like protein
MTLINLSQYRPYYHKLSIDQKIAWINKLSPDNVKYLRYETDLMLRDNQIVPHDWNGRYYIALCGRGWGKSKMGAYWIKTKVYQNQKGLAIVAPTYKDLEDVMVPAILAEFPEEHKPQYVGGNKGKIKCHNGVNILCFTSDQEIRGGNFTAIWLDELAKFCEAIPEKAQQRFEVLNFACRKGKAQFLITTTPKPWDIFFKWQERYEANDPNVCIITGTMEENQFLSENAKKALYDEFGHTRLGRQELEGTLLRDIEGAYWTHQQIDQCRQPIPSDLIKGAKKNQPLTNDQLMGRQPIIKFDPTIPYLLRILIGFDPSGSSEGDECGIVIVALYSNHHAYILEDCSGSYNPSQYAKIISDKYIQYDAAAVVVESNFGGKESFKYVLRTVNANMNVITVHSKQGKTTRAEHIASLYSQGKVHHTQLFKSLEDQMTRFNVNYSKSPDRLDALGFALTELFWPTDASGNKLNLRNLPSR